MTTSPKALTQAEYDLLLFQSNEIDKVNLIYALEYGAIVIVEDKRS